MHQVKSFETTITRVQPQRSAVSDTASVSSHRSSLSALRRLRMNRSNFGQQVQDVVSKIDNLFHKPDSYQFKSGSVVYHNRLSAISGPEHANSARKQDNQSIDSLASPGLFDAIQNLQRIHRKPSAQRSNDSRRLAVTGSASEVPGALPPLLENDMGSSRPMARRQKQISIIQE